MENDITVAFACKVTVRHQLPFSGNLCDHMIPKQFFYRSVDGSSAHANDFSDVICRYPHLSHSIAKQQKKINRKWQTFFSPFSVDETSSA